MKYFSVFTLAALFVLASCAKNEGGSAANPMADSMKNAYTALTAAWDAGNVDEFDKYMSADFKSGNAMPGYEGLEGAKKMGKEVKSAFPDSKTVIEDMRVDGDILMARTRMTGTNTGSMMGMPPTNKTMDVYGIEMARWKDGKFVENWFVMEEQKMMKQLGMIPEAGAAPADSAKKM